MISKLPKELQERNFSKELFISELNIPQPKFTEYNPSQYLNWQSSQLNTKDSDYIIFNVSQNGKIKNPDGQEINFSINKSIYKIEFPDEKIELDLNQIILQPKDSLITKTTEKYTVKLLLSYLIYDKTKTVNGLDAHLLVKTN